MTPPEDSSSGTRPISVAELLARNGTVGAPPVGGRRRRRRGNADAVSVAELTGEIPIVPADPQDTVSPQESTQEPADDETEPLARGEEPAEESAESGETEQSGDVRDAQDVEDSAHESPEAVGELPEPEPDSEPEHEPDFESEDAHLDADTDHQDTDAIPVEAPPRRRRGFRWGRRSAAAAEQIRPAPPQPAEADDRETEAAEAQPAAVQPAAAAPAEAAPAEAGAEPAEPEPGPEHSEADHQDTDAIPVEPPPRRRLGLRWGRRSVTPAVGDAEQMKPDPVVDVDGPALAVGAATEADSADDTESADTLSSYLRSTQDELFGGQTVADDLARRRVARGLSGEPVRPAEAIAEAEELTEELAEPLPEETPGGAQDEAEEAQGGAQQAQEEAQEETEAAQPSRMSRVLTGVWIVVQSILAVLFGGGLFIAFDHLWNWSHIVALILGVLVILGLVAGVRVVRRTDDIGSTLITVAVGALITFGPLALQAN